VDSTIAKVVYDRKLPKTHWLDAACVGASTPDALKVEGITPLIITAAGRGSRQMCGTNKYGFPTRHRTGQKQFFGFGFCGLRFFVNH